MTMPNRLTEGAWMQAWEESERGWGVRPDGFWFYLTETAAKRQTHKLLGKLRKAEERAYGGATPDEYSRPAGPPRFVPVPPDLAKEIKKVGWAYRERFKG